MTLPTWLPSAVELDDLEMMLLGAYRGVDGFLGPEERRHVAATGRLPDGRAWPVAPMIVVPRTVADTAVDHGALALVDEENAPVAELTVTGADDVDDALVALVGPVSARGDGARSSHPALRPAPPADPETPRSPVLAVLVDRPLHQAVLVQVRAAAETLGTRIVLMPLTGTGWPRGLDGAALVRMCLAVRGQLGADVRPLSVPRHDAATGRLLADPAADALLVRHVAAAYGATHVAGALGGVAGGVTDAGLPTAVTLPDVALDLRTGLWGLLEDVPIEHRSQRTLTEVERHLDAITDRRAPLEPGLFDVAIHRELRRLRPGGRLGFAVLFTGLSGSGKSTIAKRLRDRILDDSDRTVTLLDGDVVRRMLSSELSFSREHRVLNVRRIGFVAAQITGHGGVALCAPIAPYDDTRREVRGMVESTGAGFLLVHVATPLEVCEQRDRKGIYAKARAGMIPEFTGISDPYEVPCDADVVVDTSTVDLDETVDGIVGLAARRGWLEVD